jgi:trehalose synthase
MTRATTSDLWWKNAIVYCLDVETFLDWNGDGCGEFEGLVERVDYLGGLGVSCIWLMPFFPSPNRDDGYDITEYYGVDRLLGSLGDFVAFVRTARDRGIRVVIDLVVNHTSDQHPWFQEARQDPESRFRDYYVWRDKPADEPDAEPVFPDAEDSIWSYDQKAGQYYLHHFYSHQPDVNIANPAVREEIARLAGFWLELGVDGFRVDAVPYLFETGGISGDVDLDPHEMLKDLRAFLSRRKGHAALLGEVNLRYDDLHRYFGDETGDEIHMLLDFPLMQAMYLSLAREDAGPLAAAFESRPQIPEESQWANFVRNHDELTLDKLTDEERQEVFDAFGPEEHMQLYGRGIRRRLPTMLGGDPDRIRSVYSLLFSLPGTPILFYGEEIGMGENLAAEGRLSVRTPMQWTAGPNGGFSTADTDDLCRPLVEDEYGPQAVNVADQRSDPDSLLNWMERVVRRRRETPELGFGESRLLETDDDAVFAHRCDWEESSVLAVHNLAGVPRQVKIRVDPLVEDAVLDDLLEHHAETVPLEGGMLSLQLDRYGYRWFRIRPRESEKAP